MLYQTELYVIFEGVFIFKQHFI
uniref:Uncharacterized protein n=1 Tax=Anguilla anguilla TaxID=7936 RepID=A0A0E9RG95_ANGAN